MLKRQIERLDRLRQDVDRMVAESAAAGGQALGRALSKSGRHAQRPDYRNWAVGGTRPKSDRGVTFHFRHTFVTKGRHPSAGYTSETSASAHQAYIERKGAVERRDEDGTERLASFGTIGETKAERAEFWRKVEDAEGRRGRVQSRLIIELPHETDASAREAIARDFCRIFEERGLPYWCAIHAPSGHNDRRNFHLHIAYYDRPAGRREDGRWDFEVVEEKRYANRTTAMVRPFMQNKDRDVSSRGWVTMLRRRYADIANFHLSLSGAEKRYDPRSYRESGIPKRPTIHLGTRAFVTEMHGVDTRPGMENVRREIAFRLDAGARAFLEREEYLAFLELRMQRLLAECPPGDPRRQMAERLIARYRALAREGSEVVRKRAVHEIGLEAVTMRLGRRRRFLEEEKLRLFASPPRESRSDAWAIAATLLKEALLLDEARGDLDEFVRSCARVIAAQKRRLKGIDREQRALLEELQGLERGLLSSLRRPGARSPEASAREIQRALDIAWTIAVAQRQDAPGARRTAESDIPEPIDLDALLEKELPTIAPAALPSSSAREKDGTRTAAPQTVAPPPLSRMIDEIIAGVGETRTDASRRAGGGAGREDEPGRPNARAASPEDVRPKMGEPTGARELADAPTAAVPADLKQAAKTGAPEEEKSAVRKETPAAEERAPPGRSRKDVKADKEPAAGKGELGQETESAKDGERGRRKKPETRKATAVETSTAAPDPEQAALAALLGGRGTPRRRTAQSFPDAMVLDRPTPDGIRAFEEVLAGIGNLELRARAIATRDAGDLARDPADRIRFQTAYRIMRDIAERRGLDLETGIHDPKKAKDPELARRHLDSAIDPRLMPPELQKVK